MVDIHTHLLPNIDDGAREYEEALEVIKLAENTGFTDLFVTPHYIAGHFNNDKVLVDMMTKKLNEYLEDKDVHLNIYNGSEVYVCENLDKLVDENVIPTLNNSKYILIEIPMNMKIMYLDDIIYKLTTMGLVPILAHPERYSYVQNDPNFLLELIQKNVLIQSNYGSLIGQYGKTAEKTLEKLLKNNMVHFLSTDTHGQGYVYENMPKILSILNKIVDKKTVNLLTKENGEMVIHNKDIEIIEPTRIKKFF